MDDFPASSHFDLPPDFSFDSPSPDVFDVFNFANADLDINQIAFDSNGGIDGQSTDFALQSEQHAESKAIFKNANYFSTPNPTFDTDKNGESLNAVTTNDHHGLAGHTDQAASSQKTLDTDDGVPSFAYDNSENATAIVQDAPSLFGAGVAAQEGTDIRSGIDNAANLAGRASLGGPGYSNGTQWGDSSAASPTNLLDQHQSVPEIDNPNEQAVCVTTANNDIEVGSETADANPQDAEYEEASQGKHLDSISPPTTPGPVDRSTPVAPTSSGELKYELRPGARDKPTSFSTWVDKDTTGDYDPDAKTLRPSKRPRPNGANRAVVAPRTGNVKAVNRSISQHRREGDRYCVTLQLQSDAGIAVLRKGTDNWPDDDYINTLTEAVHPADESAEEVDSSTYKLRRREQQDLSNDTPMQDLTGHTEGRGCKFCQNIGDRCSMLDADGAYPCDNCINECEDCELLVTPPKKDHCENCRRVGRACSYVYSDDNHDAACTYCQEQCLKCIAGPAQDPTRVRMNANGQPALPTQRESRFKKGKYRSCAACRGEGKTCSLLKDKTADPPCMTCRESKVICSFEPVSRSPRNERKATASGITVPEVATNAGQAPSQPSPVVTVNSSPGAPPPTPSQSPPTETPPPAPPKVAGTIDEIKTSLSHPITFNASSVLPCHWCSGLTPYLPLLGHLDKTTKRAGGPRTVKVLKWDNKQGCKELAGGYVEHGHEPSRMCPHCTLQRVKIMFCREHHFRQIAELHRPENADLLREATDQRSRGKPQLALKRLSVVAQQARREPDKDAAGKLLRAELSRWCAVCPALATVECCAGDNMQCMLRLCPMCHKLLVGKDTNDGDFVKFVGEIGGILDWNKRVQQVYPRGLRADYDFFDWRGFMMRQVRAGQLEAEMRGREREEGRKRMKVGKGVGKGKGKKSAEVIEEGDEKAEVDDKEKGRAEVNENGKRPRA